ncbi:unnamed protein product [Penicillium egyptiacum]|uniref:Uncharacterized protein n=1 Tax=Penicillium egyptiacum TaxID=1303716 RepID=A0A9W4K610_9EURO|nr:unnamed protein product [Penicillium egyptiacum]
MAPIQDLNDNTLSPQADKQYVADMKKELFITKLLLGLIVVVCTLSFGYTIYATVKPKYEEKWKPKLRDCKEKYTDWKEKITWHAKEPKAPAPAHVARHVSEAPDVNQIVSDLTPGYTKMSTAGIV